MCASEVGKVAKGTTVDERIDDERRAGPPAAAARHAGSRASPAARAARRLPKAGVPNGAVSAWSATLYRTV